MAVVEAGTRAGARNRSHPKSRGGALTIDEVIDRRRVTSVFQPLVHLATRAVTGYECLTRGPAGTALESPVDLFDAAEACGRTGELDWVCRTAGLEAVLRADPDPTLTWFVNVEPAGLATPCPPDRMPVLHAAGSRRVVLELTERHVDRDPAGLLAAAGRARSAGWGVALDDVGADPRSLSLLPFLQPDVVKLDVSLVQGRDPSETARISNAVRAYAESTGAVILAEGIEDEDMAFAAQSLGAVYGQGWLFGRPGSLPGRDLTAAHPFPFEQRVEPDDRTPFEIASAARPVGRATKGLLLPNSEHLERQALSGGEALVLLATFQDGRHLTPGTIRRYRTLADHNVLTAALGTGMPLDVPPEIRIVQLPAGDRLTREWDVVVVGPHFAGALLARDCGDTGPDPERRFDFVITHDRDLVLRAARALLRWVTGSDA